MYYSEVSCNVRNTLDQLEKLGLNKILEADWIGLITVTKGKRIFVDGAKDYIDIGNTKIIEVLSEFKEKLLSLEEIEIYCVSKENINFNISVSPVRAQDTYKIFFVSVNLKRAYEEKELLIIKLVTKISYEKVLLNNEVIKEKNYLENIFNSTESVVLSIDLKGKITKTNRAIHDILGYECEEFVGQNLYDKISNERKEEIKKVIESVVNNNKGKVFKEYILTSKSRRKIVANIMFSPLNDGQKNVVGVVLFITDVTKIKILERELEQAKQFALLGELSAEVAHEIKNPLMSIRGCARILQKYLCENSKYSEFIEPIISEVDRTNTVIEQMLSYARMDKENSYNLLNINEILEKCCNLMSFLKEGKYINIEKNFADDIHLIKGNNISLQQVFIDILINAIQSINGEGTIKITSYNMEEQKEIGISILDTGIGINESKLDKIFEPYYSTKKDGTGLGLSVVKKIIEKHGGKIEVKSKQNIGTEFKVYLPYEEER